MAQWIKVLWNNGFVNPTRLSLLCKKAEALAIVEPGLTAGRQSDRPAVRQAVRQMKMLQSKEI